MLPLVGSMGPGAWIRLGYTVLSRAPGGMRLFDTLLGTVIPYTGSIRAHVLELDQGYARVELTERRAVQNHLKSVHAIALANLAELTGNLALVYSLPRGRRFIVRSFSIEYLKKARGVLVAECRLDAAISAEPADYELRVSIKDASDAHVAEARLRTLVGPIESRRGAA
jgi:acyl-coenzyme A thioesterase PaaI-like protein